MVIEWDDRTGRPVSVEKPADERVGPGRVISVPVKLEVSIGSLLTWVAILDVAIAAEKDAGRPAMAKELRNLRETMGSLFPPELHVNEERS